MPVKKVSETKALKKEPKTKKAIIPSASPRASLGQNDKLLSVPVFALDGKQSGDLDLPKEMFGAKVNKNLLAQAVRVYVTNEKDFTGSTKTRGEVSLTTAKWFRQKGTGRARHGAKSAPIFVGGGIAMGPKPRKVRLDLPKKMKKAALISALSSKLQDKKVLGLKNLVKLSGKTKQIALLLNQISDVMHQDKKQDRKMSALIVTGERAVNVIKATRNILGVDVLSFSMMNAYEIVKHQLLILEAEAITKMNESGDK